MTARFLGGLIIGGALGAVIGMLVAPRPGEETREMIREEFAERVNRSVDTVKSKSFDLREKAETLREKSQQIAADLEEAGRETLERVRAKVKIGKIIEESPN